MKQKYFTIFGYDESGLCYAESFLNYSDAQFWINAKQNDPDYEGVTFQMKGLYFTIPVP